MDDKTLNALYEAFRNSAGVSIDTRTLQEGQIFFALRGKQFDGSRFIPDAFQKGAPLAVADNPHFRGARNVFLVDDVLKTLQQLATLHRNNLEIPIIAITGSNGKTTTKELTHIVLQGRYNAFATSGNLNNHIGVPLSMLSIRDDHEIAVIEMGANHQGEIASLCRIALPTHGLITNIGKAHLEGFGGIEGVKKGKGELYDYLKRHGGVIFVNAADEVLRQMLGGYPHRILYNDTGNVSGVLYTATPELTFELNIRGQRDVVTIPLTGHHNMINALAAAAIGDYFNVAFPVICRQLRNYTPVGNRSQILEIKGVTVILDAYNANPVSMRLAIENLIAFPARERIAILGDMLELGKDSLKEHRLIIEQLQNAPIDKVILVGEIFSHFKDQLPCMHFNTTAELIENFPFPVNSQAVILIKGSRALQLERWLQSNVEY